MEVLTTKDKSQIVESIPRDLYNAYHSKELMRYESEEHPTSKHSAVSPAQRRGGVTYDYGKATYKVISVDDALALIRQDPHNVEKLRGIKDGELVEYEYRDGKYYNLYANPNRAVSYTKPNGEVVTKRNIRYITNPKIWLPLLDKIYVTNEYDYPISPEDLAAKQNKSKNLSFVSKFEPLQDNEYSQFDPFKHLANNAQIITRLDADTGRHQRSADSFQSSGTVYIPGYDTSMYINLSPAARATLDAYSEAERTKERTFNTYSNLRGALKKLHRDKDDYDDEEFAELLQKWETREAEAKAAYEQAALTFSRARTNLRKYSESVGNEFSLKFAATLAKISKALKQCVGLQKAIDTLKSKAAEELDIKDINSVTSELEPSFRLQHPDEYQTVKTLADTIKSTSKELADLISELEELKASTQQIDTDTSAISAAEDEKLAQIAQRLAEVNRIKKALLEYQKQYYDKLHGKMDQIEVLMNELKPGRAARKARAKAAAGQAVLDPQLTDIIQFED